ncbi:MAG: hypothetical protein QOF19_477 [Alphaproteobacteria bacterium]|jgi:hypothetical protein|nr:hypothetical protein [Alphaproteobacteria bacterium]
MRDKKLEVLISLAALFFVAHTINHVARDLRWPLTPEAIPFLATTLAVLAIVLGALALYRRGRLGARFWTIFGALSVTVGGLGHFSPFSEQPPQYIFHAYQSAAAGGLAVAALFGLMATLIAITICAGMLWARGQRA